MAGDDSLAMLERRLSGASCLACRLRIRPCMGGDRGDLPNGGAGGFIPGTARGDGGSSAGAEDRLRKPVARVGSLVAKLLRVEGHDGVDGGRRGARQPAGDERDDDEHQSDGGEGERVVRGDAEELRAHQAREAESENDAESHANEGLVAP